MAIPPERTCFIIAPIGGIGSDIRKRSDSLITHIINDVVLSFGYDPLRADNISQQGIITSQIIRRILTSPLVIADLTDGNPNVFYELAIRHMARRPIVHMMDERQKPAFDLSSLRIIKYPALDSAGDMANFLDRIKKTKDELKDNISSLENEAYMEETPITSAVPDGKELITLLLPKGRLMAEIGNETNASAPEHNFLNLRGTCRWFHIRVANNHADEMAKDCFVNLLNRRNLRTGDEKRFNSPVKWEDSDDTRLSIPKGSQKQFDAVIVCHEQPNKGVLGVKEEVVRSPGSNIEHYSMEGPGDFELTFGIYSSNFPDITIRYKLHLADNLDDIILQDM